jgi:hypothetical protein
MRSRFGIKVGLGRGRQSHDEQENSRPTNVRRDSVVAFAFHFFKDRVVGVLHGFVSLIDAPQISVETRKQINRDRNCERHDRLPLGNSRALATPRLKFKGSTLTFGALDGAELTTVSEDRYMNCSSNIGIRGSLNVSWDEPDISLGELRN